jgi:hypothetical protein
MYVARSLKKVVSGPGTGSGNTALDPGFGYITQCINYFSCFLFSVCHRYIFCQWTSISVFSSVPILAFLSPSTKGWLTFFFFLNVFVSYLRMSCVMNHDVCHDLSSCKKWPAPCTHRRRVQAEGFGHFRVSRPTP